MKIRGARVRKRWIEVEYILSLSLFAMIGGNFERTNFYNLISRLRCHYSEKYNRRSSISMFRSE